VECMILKLEKQGTLEDQKGRLFDELRLVGLQACRIAGPGNHRHSKEKVYYDTVLY